MPIIKTNGEKSAASLWLKRRERDGGKIVYIWIFEEILESTITAYLDSKASTIGIYDDDDDILIHVQ